MIEIRDLAVRFGQKTVFEHFDLDLPEKGTVLLMGESGIGKTTLLRVLSGLLTPEKGSITGLKGRRISFAFQEPRLLEWRTVLDNVSMVSDPDTAKKLLTRVAMQDELITKAGSLSGGQKQRVSLARAFAYGRDVVLLDEPFTGLDPDNRNRVAELIGEAALAIVVTHEKTDAALLHVGKIIHL